MKLCFASRNPHKHREIAHILGDAFQLLTLDEIGCREELPETASTIAGNAICKARYVWQRYGMACFAEDSGLEVDALNGAPGVHSAHYAGIPPDTKANIERLLKELQGISNRKAQFRTVIALILPHGELHTFTGTVSGWITPVPRGEQGFGYDPIFQPEGHHLTFAQMSLQEKNQISHRRRALDAFLNFLHNHPCIRR